MSLDISLYQTKTLTCDCGKVHEIETEKEVFEANITHNLSRMADEAGIRDLIWSPDTIGVRKASELIEPLRNAIKDMFIRKQHYEQFNATNGWGTYEHFMPWLQRYLEACIEYPDATIYVSR